MTDFHVDAQLDSATRELLDMCRRGGIPVTLLLAPEDSQFRSWYSQETQQRLETYLSRLSLDYGVPVIDARDWVPDAAFKDPHHLRMEGARIFTERLCHEVLRPMVEQSTPRMFVPGRSGDR